MANNKQEVTLEQLAMSNLCDKLLEENYLLKYEIEVLKIKQNILMEELAKHQDEGGDGDEGSREV